jgi:hypothetical protein
MSNYIGLTRNYTSARYQSIMSQFGASIEQRQTQLFNKGIPCFGVDEAPAQVFDDVFLCNTLIFRKI